MTNNENSNRKIDLLFRLGKVERCREWVNYLKLGFAADDIPELIELLALEELRERLQPELVHEFAPIHAWRILGQLRHANAVAPLIKLLPSFSGHDWALSELPQVFGMIGLPAIKPLTNCLLDLNQAEIARELAMESLIDIAYTSRQSREEIYAIFKALIRLANQQSRRFNSLMVINLVELQSDEFAQDIRNLYRRNLVDTSLAGNIDEVKQELDFFIEPEYSVHIDTLTDLPPMPSPASYQSAPDDMSTTIKKCLSTYAHAKSLQNLHQVDGLLTALCCSPRFLPSSILEPAIWGGDERFPSWKSEQEHHFFITAICLYKSIVSLQLEEGGHRMFAVVDDSKTQAEDWCRGFIHGAEYWELGSGQAMSKLEHILGKMFYFINQRSQAEQCEIENTQALQTEIESSVWELFRHCHPQQCKRLNNDAVLLFN